MLLEDGPEHLATAVCPLGALHLRLCEGLQHLLAGPGGDLPAEHDETILGKAQVGPGRKDSGTCQVNDGEPANTPGNSRSGARGI